MTGSSPQDLDAITTVRRRLPGFEPGEVLQKTDKTLLMAGSVDGQAVIAKVLREGDEYWRRKFDREVVAYRHFQGSPPPVVVPRLVADELATGLVVLERVAGQVVAVDRYPAEPVPPPVLMSVLNVAVELGEWQPPEPVFPRMFDYPARLDRYRDLGFLDDQDHATLSRLVQLQPETWAFCHGDLLPSNLLYRHDGRCAVLDWEFAGYALPGYDLALLWAVLVATPQARPAIETRVEGNREAFLVNLAMVLTRELRIHAELPSSEAREMRLRILTEDWDRTRIAVRAAGDARR